MPKCWVTPILERHELVLLTPERGTNDTTRNVPPESNMGEPVILLGLLRETEMMQSLIYLKAYTSRGESSHPKARNLDLIAQTAGSCRGWNVLSKESAGLYFN